MITQLRNKETGFSLLELSVAVGVAAIVASAGIVATTTFIGGAAEKRDNYVSNAETSISNAESSSLALGAAGVVEETPEPTPPASGVVSATAYDSGERVATFSIDGSTYTAYNEGGDVWSSSNPVLSVALPLSNGQYSGYNSDGYYMWEAASTDPQNHYGYSFNSSTQIVPTETGALIFLNNDEVFQGFSVMFDGDPFNGGQIVNNTEWASQYQASGVNSFGMPTQDWFMNLDAWGNNGATIMGDSGPWTGSAGYCLGCGVGGGGVNVGGLTGWAVKIGDNGAWLPFDIAEMADGLVFPGNNWDFLDYLNQTHGVTEIQQGEKVQLRTPNGTYSNIYVSDTPFTLGN